MKDGELTNHRLILYSGPEPEHKANAALLITLYAVGIANPPNGILDKILPS
jgi:hypothetical protein